MDCVPLALSHQDRDLLLRLQKLLNIDCFL